MYQATVFFVCFVLVWFFFLQYLKQPLGKFCMLWYWFYTLLANDIPALYEAASELQRPVSLNLDTSSSFFFISSLEDAAVTKQGFIVRTARTIFWYVYLRTVSRVGQPNDFFVINHTVFSALGGAPDYHVPSHWLVCFWTFWAYKPHRTTRHVKQNKTVRTVIESNFI